jgi:hypothetical protein
MQQWRVSCGDHVLADVAAIADAFGLIEPAARRDAHVI